MMEYKDHITFYKNYWFSSAASLISESEWGDSRAAEEFLAKYWLSGQEYQLIWKPIQDSIFINQAELPNLLFVENFEVLILKGGCLFIEEEFIRLQSILQHIGEKYFVVIQNKQDFTLGEPVFRMKFPATISWDELISGNYISAVLLEMNYNEYFIFGLSGNWAKYSATEYIFPLDIYGFKHEYASIFKEKFKQPKNGEEEIKKWVPATYKRLIT